VADRIRQLERYVAELVRRVEESERRLTNVVRMGRVTQVDAQKGLVKLAYAKDENGADVVSPWLRWQERAGGIKTWSPPSVGEQVLMFSPSGDISGHSWALPGGYSQANPPPHDKGGEHKMTIGNLSILATGDDLNIEAPGKVVIKAGQIAFDGDVTLGGQPGAGELVHRKGDVDAGGDLAQGAATRVRAV
jgi:phage baseplate assembly protein V